RRGVAHDLHGPALEKTIKAIEKKGFTIGGDQLSRVPKGYEKDHPREALLRHKTLTASKELGFPDWLHTSKAKSEIAKQWKAMGPLVAWLDQNVGPA
ncbi:MAG TPA: DUF2461 family protein, partial [Sporichthya sp.]|nr:DUF2461 family protein [Sporichthya sp.]